MTTPQPFEATTNAPPTSAPSATAADPRQLRAILIAVCIALMAVVASASGLNVAQPDLAVDFNASQSTILWFINIYALALAALLLPLGAIGDRVGRKPMLVAGLAVFGLASAMAALAPSTEVMLIARLLSGVGAAMIMPITLAVITSTFPPEQRSKAIGVWTGVAGGGGILGMFLSALLVDVASWRWLFVLPIALVVAALVMTLHSVPNSRRNTTHPFDAVGALTSVVAVVGLIFALQEGPERGWTDLVTLTSLVAGLVAGVCFTIWERRRRTAALLDVRLFGERGLAGGSITLLTVFGVQAGIFVVLFPFFQAVLGWSGLESTLALMPMAVLMMGASGLAPLLAARIGARSTMATGILVAGAGLALIASSVSVHGGYLSILPGMLAMGLGMGLSMTPPLRPSPARCLPNAKVWPPHSTTSPASSAQHWVSHCSEHSWPPATATPSTAGSPGSPSSSGSRPRGRRERCQCRWPGRAWRASADRRRPAVLRRRLAAGHVGRSRRHGGPIRVHLRPRPPDHDARGSSRR